jgi:hypothetical protein
MKRKTIRKRKSSARVKSSANESRSSTPPTEPFAVLVAANTRSLGIKIDPSWEAGIIFNLQLIFSHAVKVDDFELSDDAEPAAIFHA